MMFDAQVVGLKEANRALRRLPAFAQEEAQRTFDVTAFHFARMASASAPRDTGTLANSITWKSRPRSLSAVVLINQRDAFYWKFQEYGTKTRGARPFLRPTAVRLSADHRTRLLQGLGRAMARMAREGILVG